MTAQTLPRVPTYRRHKPTGQAVVTLDGHDIYLGKWNSTASRRIRPAHRRMAGRWPSLAALCRFARRYHYRTSGGLLAICPKLLPKEWPAHARTLDARSWRFVGCGKSRRKTPWHSLA